MSNTAVRQKKFAAAAAELRKAYDDRTPIAPLRERIRDLDVDAAYQIQELSTQHWLAQGRRLVGRKIGLTSRAVQKQLGVNEPDFGMLFADMARPDGDEVVTADILQPKIEAEVAFVLGRDLNLERHTFADLLRAIEFCVPALEIVGSRIANWDIRLTDTVADNASSGLYVLGGRPTRLSDVDLTGCAMRMARGDETVSEGNGRACMGHPLAACAWLADEMTRRERPLRAGDVIMSGALGPMVPIQGGERIEALIEGLGSVSASFTA